MSVFSEVPASERLFQNDLAFAIRDKFPMSKGHALIVTVREIASWFETTPEERAAIFDLVDLVAEQLRASLRPLGFRVMVNDGSSQHIPHVHVHLIPNYEAHP